MTGASTDRVKANEALWPTHIRYELWLQVFNERQLQVQAEYLLLFPAGQSPKRGPAQPIGDRDPGKDWHFIIRRAASEPAELTRQLHKSIDVILTKGGETRCFPV
ncbi:MAG: hypothetical protein GXX96_32975 [Planctomycetaceae bacterium]|nr:hypothetical protein [Planctomycetaceae bacterium]